MDKTQFCSLGGSHWREHIKDSTIHNSMNFTYVRYNKAIDR